MDSIRNLPAVAVLFFSLAACGQLFPTAQPQEGIEDAVADPSATSPIIQATDTGVPVETEPAAALSPEADEPEESPSPTALPTATEVMVADDGDAEEKQCPFHSELRATSPATVSLASGQVQLVEFFAFW